MDNYLQIRAMNLGMNYQDFIVLIYLKEHMYMNDFKYQELFNDYPLFLGRSKDVSDALSILSKLEFISYDWNKGKFSVEYNTDKFVEFFTPDKEQVIKIVRPTNTLKQKEDMFNKKELDIIDYYKDLPTLPKVVSMTPRRISALKNAIENYSIDDIKDALLFASKQQWLIDKTGEQWCDMSWILNKISDFMPNGKYNKEVKKIAPILDVKSGAVFL